MFLEGQVCRRTFGKSSVTGYNIDKNKSWAMLKMNDALFFVCHIPDCLLEKLEILVGVLGRTSWSKRMRINKLNAQINCSFLWDSYLDDIGLLQPLQMQPLCDNESARLLHCIEFL